MCVFSTPDTPPLPKAPPVIKQVDSGVKASKADDKRKAVAAAGRSGTILTGSSGLFDQQANIKKTKLGQ